MKPLRLPTTEDLEGVRFFSSASKSSAQDRDSIAKGWFQPRYPYADAASNADENMVPCEELSLQLVDEWKAETAPEPGDSVEEQQDPQDSIDNIPPYLLNPARLWVVNPEFTAANGGKHNLYNRGDFHILANIEQKNAFLEHRGVKSYKAADPWIGGASAVDLWFWDVAAMVGFFVVFRLLAMAALRRKARFML